MRDYIKKLEKGRNLIHITEELSTRFEISAAMRYIAESISKAVIFDNVRDHCCPNVSRINSVGC